MEEPVLPKSLEYISCLTHLAVFGILGVSFQGFTHDSFQLSGSCYAGPAHKF